MSPGCYGSCYLGSNVRFSLVFTTSDKNPPHNRQVRSVCSTQFLNHLPSTIFTEKSFKISNVAEEPIQPFKVFTLNPQLTNIK